MKNKSVLISIIFLTIIGVCFFYKFFLKGLIPIPSDITTGMYYPWINHNYGYPVRVPVKNPILTDTVSQFWIWRNWGVNNLKNHQVTFWNPYSLSGYSMSPWFHTILFSPANIFYLFFNTTTSMALIVISQLIISLIATYLLIKLFTTSDLAAIFGSISFSFSSFFIGWITWGTISWTLAFLPLTILFIHKLLYQKITFTNCLFLYTSLIFSLLGGHPQTFLYVLIIIFIYLFTFYLLNKKQYKKLFPIFIIFLLCILSTLFTTIPSLQILQASIRNTENYIQAYGSGFIPIGKNIITLFAPNFFGSPSTNNYWGGDSNYQEKLVWFGTTSLILSIFYLISLLKNKKIKHVDLFLLITFFLGLLLSTKYPIGFLIYKFKLPLLSTSSAARAMILVGFSGSILASLAIKKLILNSKENKFSLKWVSIIFTSFVSILLGVIFLSKYYNPLPFEFINNLNIAFRNTAIPLGVSVVTILIILLIIKIKKNNKFFISLFIVLAIFEGFYYGWKYTPFTDKNLYFPKTDAINFIEEKYHTSPYPFRIEREKAELMPPNMWQIYGFSSTSGYDPILPQTYANYLIKNKIIEHPSRYVEWENNFIDNISGLGVKYFLTLKRGKDDKPNPYGLPPKWLNYKKWNKVYEEGAVMIFENNNFSPPYYFKDDKNIDYTNLVKFIKKEETYWEFKLDNPQEGTLILLENTDPNWKVFVNDKQSKIIPFEETFKSVKLEPGKNKVVFIYQNSLFNFYLILSLFSVFISILVFVLFTKTRLTSLINK
ncbi:MAG: hypothetical protein Q8P53_01740 [Candidatus Shapirobacteria bacterium]|nr:hypothetical protein [Candidatus Shapirobacteria bacterium]